MDENETKLSLETAALALASSFLGGHSNFLILHNTPAIWRRWIELRKSSGPASGSSDDDPRQPYWRYELKAGLRPKDSLLNQSSALALYPSYLSLSFSLSKWICCASDRLSYLNLQLLLKRSAIN